MPRTIHATILLAFFLFLSSCEGRDSERDSRPEQRPAPTMDDSPEATAFDGVDRLSPEALEQARRDGSWRRVVGLEERQNGLDNLDAEAAWSAISVEQVNTGPTQLPLTGNVAGASVVRMQILLDRAHFSPGIIDGWWGANTEKAVYWLQEREGLSPTGEVDKATFDRLVRLAGNPQRLIAAHRLSEKDVAGPFVEIPEDIYEQEKLDCMCYESLSEKLGERFHTSPALLRQLNPDVNLDEVRAGQSLMVPNVREAESAPAAPIARILISDAGKYLHALDANDRILYHFPTTLGSQYDPSPAGVFEVTSITEDPWWHYQPAILAHVDDDEEEARIPPGPNSPVGVIWIALSKPHYGIHGTRAPETIGYTTSAGCVRLTNWDALFLGRRLEKGTRVQFRDVEQSPSTTGRD